MKLIGYIKPYKTFSSSIPIYFEDENYYYHSLDDKFKIINFYRAYFDLNFLILLKKQKTYEIGNIGPIVFVGENEKICFIGDAKKTIIDICNYFDTLNYTKRYVQEEIFYYANELGINVCSFKNKFYLKNLIQNNYSILKPDINELIKLIEDYTKEYFIKRSRKSSFKHQKKSKASFGVTVANYNNLKIESYKNYFIDFIKLKEYRKAFHELKFLINYQSKVSTPEHIVKSICDISSSLIETGAIVSSKTLLLLAKLFNVKDKVIETQFAEILKAEGNIKDAKALYIEIQKQFPDDVVARNGYAEILKAEGNIKEAKAVYVEIQKQFPDDVVARNGYAEILKTEGNIKEAKALYVEIKKQFPENIIVQTGYAEILKAEGNIKEAKALYIEIQKQFPNDVVARNGYAEILKAEGNIKEAKAVYIEIQKQFPENVVSKTGYAEILKAEGNIQEAKALYIEIQKQFPENVVSKTGYAEILKSEGNLKEAKTIYLEIQKQFPENVVAKNGYTEILKIEGNMQEAKALYLEIQKQFPENVIAKNGYAEILKIEGNLQESKALYIEIQKQFPENVVLKNCYAEILKAEGNIKEAKALYIEIQKQFPEDVVAKNGYAEILKAEGNIKEAKAVYIEIQKQFPENLISKNGYAEILKAEGNIKGAKELYLEIQSQFPYDLFSRHSLLNCYLILNETNKINVDLFVKSNPKSQGDYYFYHSYIIYNIKIGEFEIAEKLILDVVKNIPYRDSKIIFERTLIYVKILQLKFQELLDEVKRTSSVESNPIESIFQTHIYAENGDFKNAIKCFSIIKKFPKDSIIYSNATLLSEIYTLNGLPKKGLDKLTLNQMLIEEELKALTINL